MPFSKRAFGVSLKHSSALFKKGANAQAHKFDIKFILCYNLLVFFQR